MSQAAPSLPASTAGGHNELIQKWVSEWRDAARKANSKVEFTYLKALKSLREYKEPLRSGVECKKLKGFGDKICGMIEKKLKEHLGNAYCPPVAITLGSPKKNGGRGAAKAASSRGGDDYDHDDDDDLPSSQSTMTQMFPVRKRLNGPAASGGAKSPSVASPLRKVARPTTTRNRAYIPAQGSSGFAILVALLRYELEFNQKLVNKLDLQEMAVRYSSASIGQATTAGQRYSGWATVKTLIGKELVAKTDARNSYFYLTDSGRALARNLAKVSPVLRDFAEQFLTAPAQPTTSSNDGDDDVEILLSDDDDDESPCQSKQSQPPPTETLPTFRPFIFEPGAYEIILCIDTRERIQTNFCSDKNAAFAAALQKQDVRVEIRQLPLGDFIWIAREKPRSYANDLARFASVTTGMNSGASASSASGGGVRPPDIRKELVLDHIIERKRIDDLAGSIKDRRWDEQKHRLRNCGIRRPAYLIEYMGKQSKRQEHGGLKPDTLDQAITNCEIDGFDVKRTDNFEETVRYLTFMTRWLERKYSGRTLMSAPNKDALAKTSASDFRYITFNEFAVNSAKVQRFTAKEMLVKHLLQIKGLSLPRVNAIVERYPTLAKFLTAYERRPDLYSKHNMLTDMKTDSVVGANRRFGLQISKKVFEYYNSLE